MADRDAISRQIEAHYEAAWRAGDPWELPGSDYEQTRYAHHLEMLAGRRYPRVLEVGCGSGRLTALLAGIADRVIAVDVSLAAIERARQRISSISQEGVRGAIEFRVADVIQSNVVDEGPWDLVVLSEVIYCLGWLYPFFDVAYFASRLFNHTHAGGRLLLANTIGDRHDWLQRPWLIATYRDLFRNVGFEIEREDIFRGVKDDTPMEVPMTLFTKPIREP